MKYIPLLVALMCAPLTAQAQEEKYTDVRLISSVEAVGDLSEIVMGIDVTMKDGWYTYWRMPGDNGVAPVLSLTGSQNVKDIQMAWPVPQRHSIEDMHSFGYQDHVLFPAKVVPEVPGQEIVLNLKLDLMVCKDICIPESVTIERTIPAGEAKPSADAPKIEEVIAALPRKENMDDLGIGTAILGKDAVVVTVQSKEALAEGTDLIIEAPGGILSKPPEIIAPDEAGGDYILKVRGPKDADLTQLLFGKTVKATLISGDQAIEKEITF